MCSSLKPASLRRSGRHHHSLCHQVNIFKPASLRGRSLPTPPTSRRVLVPLPADTTFKTRSAARRPHVRGACPALIIGGVKCLQRRRNISAWRGHEDNGGEGQLGREPGYSGGGQFFLKENLCKLLFVRILLSLSQVKVNFGHAPFVFVQHVTRA